MASAKMPQGQNTSDDPSSAIPSAPCTVTDTPLAQASGGLKLVDHWNEPSACTMAVPLRPCARILTAVPAGKDSPKTPTEVNLRPGTSLPASTLIVGFLVWAMEFSLLRKRQADTQARPSRVPALAGGHQKNRRCVGAVCPNGSGHGLFSRDVKKPTG